MFRGMEQFNELNISPTFDLENSSGSSAKTSIRPLQSKLNINNSEEKDLAIGACDEIMHPVEITQNINETYKLNKVRGCLSTRSDVVNKGLLRSIKTYYLKKFKRLNYVIVRRRFTNVKTSECIEALEEFLRAEFQNDDIAVNYQKFAKFMVVFLNLKSMKSISFEKSIIAKGLQARD